MPGPAAAFELTASAIVRNPLMTWVQSSIVPRLRDL